MKHFLIKKRCTRIWMIDTSKKHHYFILWFHPIHWYIPLSSIVLMLFWLILHSLQLSGVEAAETEFSDKKVDTKLLNQIKSKCDEILGEEFLWKMTGNHRRRRWGDPPGSQKGAERGPPPGRARHPPGCLVAPLGAPFCLFNPPGVETPKGELLLRFAAATGRKPIEEKSHLRRADSAGEIISRKGRSSPSSSSRASSRSSSTSSPTSAPSLSTSHLISQLQLVL